MLDTLRAASDAALAAERACVDAELARRDAQIAALQVQVAALQARLDALSSPHAAQYSCLVPDPAFQVASLPEAVQQPYTYAWTQLASPQLYPNPVTGIQYADAANWVAGGSPQNTREGTLYYQAGRTLSTHYYALALALVSTHDGAIVDEMARLMNVLKPLMVKYPTPPFDLDEVLTYNLVAFHALVMAAAGRSDEAAYWLKLILTRVDTTWGGMVMQRSLAHAYIASMLTNWIMYLLTNQPRFLVKADAQKAVFQAESHLVNGILTWDHRMPIISGALGCQDVGYARYTMLYLLVAQLLGYPVADPAQLAATVGNFIHADCSLANDICGAGTYPKPNEWTVALYSAFARYDTTGKIAAESAAKFKEADHSIFIPVGQVYAGMGQ